MSYVLIVDDDAGIRMMMTDILTSFGLECKEAVNGAVAVKMAKEEAPAVVILDLMMPVMDGFTALTRLQADKSTREVPVIVMSAIADTTRMRGLPGVKGVLRKGDLSLARFRQTLTEIGVLPSEAAA